MQGLADCAELQKDWNSYGAGQFEATIICIGPEWETKEARLKKEREIISSYLPQEVYNNHPSTVKIPAQNYRVSCNINGIVYDSIAEASRVTGESETRIRAKLDRVEGYTILAKIPNGYSAIIANGKPYDSITAACEAGEANDRFEVIRNLKNKKLKDWNYQDPARYIDKDTTETEGNAKKKSKKK